MTIIYDTKNAEQLEHMKQILAPLTKNYSLVHDVRASQLIGSRGILLRPAESDRIFNGINFLPALRTPKGGLPSASDLEKALVVESASNNHVTLRTADKHTIILEGLSREKERTDSYHFAGLAKLLRADENGIRVYSEGGGLYYPHVRKPKHTQEEINTILYA